MTSLDRRDFLRLSAFGARPEGRIHFAGEHASPYPGWIQGALWSGHRAADTVAALPTSPGFLGIR